jgi:hypothetical protein
MNRQELRRKALVAAASVTLAFGCRDGGKIVEPVDTDLAAVDSALADTDPVDTVDTPADTTDTPADTDRAVVDTDPTITPPTRPDCVALGLDLTACCDTLRDWCGQQVAEGTPAYDDCVFGPGFDGSTGCIPWGPPVPPALA